MVSKLFRTVALAAALALAGVGAARAETFTESFTEPFDGFVNCGTDTIAATGEWHVVDHLTTDAAGGLHAFITVNFVNASGIGTNGAIYRAVGSYSNIVEFTPGADADIQLHQDVTWVGLGGAPTFFSRIFVLVTVTPTGHVTSIDTVSEECR